MPSVPGKRLSPEDGCNRLMRADAPSQSGAGV